MSFVCIVVSHLKSHRKEIIHSLIWIWKWRTSPLKINYNIIFLHAAIFHKGYLCWFLCILDGFLCHKLLFSLCCRDSEDDHSPLLYPPPFRQVMRCVRLLFFNLCCVCFIWNVSVCVFSLHVLCLSLIWQARVRLT